jgi:sporulation integral membrane protein YtvI
MYEFYEKHKPRIHRMIFFAGFLLFVFIFFNFLFEYISPFFFGMLIALILGPLTKFLKERARFLPWMAAAVSLILFMAAISGIGTWLISTLINQAGEFVKAAPEMIDEISIVLSEWQSKLPSVIAASDIESTLLSALTSVFGDGLMVQSRRIVTNAPSFLISVILSLVSAFFILKDRDRIVGVLKKHCPDWIAVNLRTIRGGLMRAVGGYFRAQAILMSITCIIALTGLIIMRSPYALILGLLLAFLDFLPFFGTGFILIPWAALCLLTAEYVHAIGLAVLYGVIFITRQVLEPKVLSEQIGVYPLVTLMAIFIGFKLFGFIGILVGPALVMTFLAMYRKQKETH